MTLYVYRIRQTKWGPVKLLYGKLCRIVKRRGNKVLVEWEDGTRDVTDRWALRKVKEG